jgi:hypothetical protein
MRASWRKRLVRRAVFPGSSPHNFASASPIAVRRPALALSRDWLVRSSLAFLRVLFGAASPRFLCPRSPELGMQRTGSCQPRKLTSSGWVPLVRREVFGHGVPSSFAGARPGVVSAFVPALPARFPAAFVWAKRRFPRERLGSASEMQTPSQMAAPAEDCWAKERACRSDWRSQPKLPERRSGLVLWERLAAGPRSLVFA